MLTVLAALAGACVAYIEHQRRPRALLVPTERARSAKVPPPKEPVPPPAKSKDEPKPTPSPAPPPGPSKEALEAEIRAIETLILREGFAEASARAKRFVEAQDAGLRNPEAKALLDRIARLESRAFAFAGLTKALPARKLPEQLFRVKLENGNSVVALAWKEELDRHEFEYALGGKGSMPKDRVAAVSPLKRAEYLAERWTEIRTPLEKSIDPLDLFFFGVRRCFRDGLRLEGIGLLERLLAIEESGQVVALYSQDPTGETTRHWEIAAGRRPAQEEPPGESLASALQPGDAASPPDTVGEETGDEFAIRRVREIVARAEEAAEKGARFDARMLLQSAAKLLYALPATNPEVRDLNKRTGTLLESVMKAD